MDPDYVASFRAVTDYDNLRQKLQTQRQVELLFHKRDDTWLRLRVFAMPGYTPESQKTLWVFEDNTTTVNLRQEEEKARVTAQAWDRNLTGSPSAIRAQTVRQPTPPPSRDAIPSWRRSRPQLPPHRQRRWLPRAGGNPGDLSDCRAGGLSHHLPARR